MMRVSSLFVVLLCGACVGTIGDNPIQAKPIELELVESEVVLSAAPGFADERGGGIFLADEGVAVRLRADGSKGRLESHPGNESAPGAIQRVFATGPFSALVVADNGVYMAESGWLIEPRWRDALPAEGLRAVAAAGDGIAWIAHDRGLFRLEAGELFELAADGESLTEITALAVAPAPSGGNAVWFAQGATLLFAEQTARQRYAISDGGLSKDDLGGQILALAAVSAAPSSPGQLWLISERTVFAHGPDGWQRFKAKRAPNELVAAGRFVWLRAGDQLYRYDVQTNGWGALADTQVERLLSADASGTLWLQTQGKTMQARPFALPRLLGLFEGARLYTADLHLRALWPADAAPEWVSFVLDDGTPVEQEMAQAMPGESALATLDFALGGFDAAGREKSYSLAGLDDGLHALTVRARFEDREVTRTLNFELSTKGGGALSYERDVRPIFGARCAKCHEQGPGHVLTSYEDWVNDKERIVAAVIELRMPADGPLDPAQIKILQRWAAGGALP